MHEYRDQLKEAFNSTNIIGYCTSVSVLVYGGITYFLLSRSHESNEASDIDGMFVKAVGGLAAILFLGMAVVRKFVLKMNAPKIITVETVIKQLQSTALVVFGGCEMISILGLVLALLTLDMQNYYWMAFLSLIAFGTYFPRYDRWDAHMHAMIYKEDMGQTGG